MPPTNPTTSGQPPPDIEVINPLAVMQPGETVIFVLRRHPIGLLIAYFLSLFVLALAAVLVFVITPGIGASTHKSQIDSTAQAGFIIFAVLVLLFDFVYTIVYGNNRWVLTDDSLTQMKQTGLFNVETSQLGLDNIEDVTTTQNSFLQRLLNYGTLAVETAGEQGKFVFPYCPNPTKYARQILAAHERELARLESESKR